MQIGVGLVLELLDSVYRTRKKALFFRQITNKKILLEFTLQRAQCECQQMSQQFNQAGQSPLVGNTFLTLLYFSTAETDFDVLFDPMTALFNIINPGATVYPNSCVGTALPRNFLLLDVFQVNFPSTIKKK